MAVQGTCGGTLDGSAKVWSGPVGVVAFYFANDRKVRMAVVRGLRILSDARLAGLAKLHCGGLRRGKGPVRAADPTDRRNTLCELLCWRLVS